MSTSVRAPKKQSGVRATAPVEAPRAENTGVEPKKSDVVLTIKVILIAIASIAALWMLDRFVTGQ